MPRLGMPVLMRSISSESVRLANRKRIDGANSPPAPSPPWHTEQLLSYCRWPGSEAICGKAARAANRKQTSTPEMRIRFSPSISYRASAIAGGHLTLSSESQCLSKRLFHHWLRRLLSSPQLEPDDSLIDQHGQAIESR